MKVNKFKIYCETEAAWKYVLVEDGDPAPTTCPTDAQHTVTAGSVAVEESVEENSVLITRSSVITPTSPLNEHSLEPWGCTKGHIVSNVQACEITLSDKSQNGLTFTYSSTLDPAVGSYVFQNFGTNRSWITAVDTVNHTCTFELPYLINGTGMLSNGVWIDQVVRDFKPLMYLWGVMMNVTYSAANKGRDDFLEFSIVDKDDLFLNEQFCQAAFGVSAANVGPILESLSFEQNGEYGHWTKYYDESWVSSTISKMVSTPDGAPGVLIPGLYLRVSYFTTETDTTITEIYLDYVPTSRDGD